MGRNHSKLSSVKAKLVSLTAPVEIAAELADSEGKLKPATFAAKAYTGVVVPGSTAAPRLPHDYVIDLAGTKVAKSNFANLDHKSEQRVGHLTKVENNGRELYIEGVLSAATKYRDEVLQSTRDGMPWEVSIEANLGGRKFIPRGETAWVNGRQFAGPLFVFSKNTFTDVAFVSHGADDGNAVRIAATAAGVVTMTEFEKWLAACGVDAATIGDTQRAALQSAFDAEQAKLSAGKNDGNAGEGNGDGAEAKLKAAEDRLAKLTADFEHKVMLAQLSAKLTTEYPDDTATIAKLAAQAEKEQWSAERFELEVMRALRGNGTISILSRSGSTTIEGKVYEAALALNAGLPEIEKHYDEKILQQVDDNRLRGFGIQQCLLQAAMANGYQCRPGEGIHVGNLRGVLEHAFPERRARLSGFSLADVGGIVTAVANKEILAGYMEEDQTWREVAAVKPVRNFQLHTSYRMLDDLEYDEIGPTGQIKHGTLGNESYTRQAKTYAKMLGLSREMIVNDDLSAFSDIRERLGRGAALKFNAIFWAEFINNSTFFTTAITNYTEGATTNLGTDGVGLGLGVLAFRKMRTPTADGSKRVGIGARPTLLLAPPELEANARGLYTSRNLVTGANTTMGDNNIYANLYRPVIQNRLSDSSFTGYSTTAWYLFGDGLKPMVVSFLNGNQTPVVESADADFNQLGVQFRGYHDFGADLVEPLSGVKVKGAA